MTGWRLGSILAPAIDFGGHRADKHVRFAYTIGREKLEEGVARLRRFLAPEQHRPTLTGVPT